MKTYFSQAKIAGAGLTLALPAKTNLQRILTWLSMTNDKASTYMSIWRSTLSRATAGGAAGQKVMLCTLTAGIVLNDVVIIQDVVDPAIYEIQTMGAVAANVSYTMGANLVNTYSAGAKVYRCVGTGGTQAADWVIPCGIATVDKTNATAIFVAEKDSAIYMKFDSATATCEYVVSGILRS
jgi:hypothetical protein